MHLTEITCESGDWVELPHNAGTVVGFCDKVMNLRVP
jgi:hypothetical protein